MRQTSQAAVEQQGLRDVERWKDKIEIRLDNRQVAFLFFGSALIACLLFILGVIVGKRLESRGHAMAPEIEDPLALLDRVASSLPVASAVATRAASDVAVSRAHAAPANRPPAVTVAAVAPASAKPAKSDLDVELARPARSQPVVEDVVALAPPAKPGKKPDPAADLTAKTATIATVARSAAPVAVEAPKAAALTPPKPSTLTVAAAPKPALPTEQPRAASPELLPPSGLAGSALTATAPAAAAPAPAAAATAVPAAVPGKSRFMLQVGSFLDRAEAEAFASAFASERPVVVTSDVPGKGTWFRVRVGEFRAFKEAVEAKLTFERRFNKIALVVGPL